ncbi:phytoene desaturase family protein [Alienimonas californiensis]|uniref:Amine oxidase domain-containing protein n=1 Tax=Alienimonas californiensis TaxID=2527989 RepID=A0A517P9T4_9PLAN|nr:NAD(P)-binding protein [Alienimonas californiensis]QDT16137.1 hypothetical protein CA12_22350 [Alienimonas californiensis]
MASPAESYDVLIIGAGLSGLAAGIRLAHYEKRVAILERHTTIGGLNSFYQLRGRRHDVGLHAVTNFRPPTLKPLGPLAKLLRQLRISWDEFDLAPQCGSRVTMPGASLRFTNDFAGLQGDVAEQFPGQIDGFNRLDAASMDADTFDESPGFQPSRERVREFITDPLLEDLLFAPVLFYGSPTPHDCDWRQFAILWRALYREGFGRPFDGVKPILKTLVRRYKALGGDLWLRHGVKAIRSSNGTILGVTLDDGTEIDAPHVLSSAGLPQTADLAGDAAELPRDPGPLSFVESISVLDRPAAELGYDDTVTFYSTRDPRAGDRFRYANSEEPCDLTSGIACSPDNYQYDAPHEEGCLRLTVLANPQYWAGLEPDAYQAEKARWHAAALDAGRDFGVLPDLTGAQASHVLDTDVFTPNTITRFTGHPNGAVYGSATKLRDGRTGLEGLHVIGTDQGYLGIVGAMLSGVSIANRLLT